MSDRKTPSKASGLSAVPVVALAAGDGIGPEISQAVISILEASGAELHFDHLAIGLQAYKDGHAGGIPEAAWEQIEAADVILKAPITTPSGGGVKSLNVSLRKRLGLAVNLRPCRSYAPYVQTRHPLMDLVIVRENEEDLYAGIEYQQSQQSVQAVKLITRPGCERVIRYAFDYARANGHKKVTALVKDNIMKMSDGMFWDIFQATAKQYPDLENERLIVDIGMARVADTPEDFEVIVCQNLYGDILSDITAQLSGSVGMCGSANLGEQHAMFEAIHGSAPDLAGTDKANPSGMLQAACLMLEYLGDNQQAKLIQNAWLATLEQGIHTIDLESELTTQTVGTQRFAAAVIRNLGSIPSQMKPARSAAQQVKVLPAPQPIRGSHRQLAGVDVFIHHHGPVTELAETLQSLSGNLTLSSIACRGAAVWPQQSPQALLNDQLCARMMHPEQQASPEDSASLLVAMNEAGVEFVGTQHLYLLNGQPGWTALQGD